MNKNVLFFFEVSEFSGAEFLLKIKSKDTVIDKIKIVYGVSADKVIVIDYRSSLLQDFPSAIEYEFEEKTIADIVAEHIAYIIADELSKRFSVDVVIYAPSISHYEMWKKKIEEKLKEEFIP